MTYTIVGRDHGHAVVQTRQRPSGAALLADLWMRSGFTEVHIDWRGHSFDLAEFRAQFVLTANGTKPRSTISA